MEQNQFSPENETPLFEGQPIEQIKMETEEVSPQAVDMAAPLQEEQVVSQPVEQGAFTEEPLMSQPTEMATDSQAYHTPLFAQPTPAQDMPLGQPQTVPVEQPSPQESVFGAPISTEHTQYEQMQPQNIEEQFTEPNMFIPAAPLKPKSNKKLITVIVSSVIVIVLLVLGGLYGYSVYTKTQALETTKSERNSLKKKTEELQENVTKLGSFDELKEKLENFETCLYGASSYDGVDGGRVFHFSTSGSYELKEKTESQFKELLKQCKEKTNDIKFDGAQEKIDAEIKKLEEAYTANSQFLAEAKTVLNEWNEFKSVWKTGLIEEAEFNRIRDAAAKAMGVAPSTLGNRLTYSDISSASYSRMSAIQNKQKQVSSIDFKNYIANVKDAYQAKQEELEKAKKDLDTKEKELQEKESKVWNPFQ